MGSASIIPVTPSSPSAQVTSAGLLRQNHYADTRALMQAVRAACSPLADCIFNISTEFFRPSPLLGDNFVPVILLCLPDYGHLRLTAPAYCDRA